MNFELKAEQVYIEITSYCNRNCPYCYNDSSGKDITILDKITIFNIIDNISGNNITISGGEPFFHPNIEEIIEYANGKNISANVISNISTVSNDVLLNLISKGNTLQITLDSLDKEQNDKTRGQGSYDLIENLLNELSNSEYKQQIQLRFNLSKTNLNEIQKAIDFAIRKGLKHLQFAFLVRSGRAINYPYLFDYKKDLIELNKTIEYFKYLKKQYEEKINITYSTIDQQVGCVLFKNGKISITPRVDPEGNVFLCQLFVGKESSIGNLKNSSLEDVLKSPRAINFVEKLRLRKEKNSNCYNCPFSNGCMCGCPAISYLNTGDMMNITDQCNMIKYFYKEKLKLKHE